MEMLNDRPFLGNEQGSNQLPPGPVETFFKPDVPSEILSRPTRKSINIQAREKGQSQGRWYYFGIIKLQIHDEHKV